MANTLDKEVTKSIVQGHKKYGPIGQRRPEEDDNQGGTGSGSLIKAHPFFWGLPAGMGADSNMSATNDNPEMEKEAEKNPNLSPALQQKLDAKLGFSSAPTLKATG